MGGSGNRYGGSGTGNSSADPCEISFSVDLYSPVAGVADKLSKGQVLAVRLTPANAVGVFPDNEVQAGTLVGPKQLPTLIRCLEDGVKFVADVANVTESEAGLVRLRVRCT